jgi:GT2 family glycosyltransferase
MTSPQRSSAALSPVARPFLHVLIPSYGASPYLAQAIGGALAAADGTTVVTVVDDGTPGNAVEVTTRRAGAAVEYVRLESNLGIAGAFQHCVEISRGEYTVITGSDDEMTFGYVAAVRHLVAAFERPAMVLPGVRVIDEAGQEVRPLADRVKRLLSPHAQQPIIMGGDRLAASLLTGNWLYFPAMAWRTEELRAWGFRQDMTTALDLDLALRAVFSGARLAVGTEVCFSYRRHGTSVSSVEARDGRRFLEERALHRWAADEARRRHWLRSSIAGRLRITSRLHRAMASRRPA